MHALTEPPSLHLYQFFLVIFLVLLNAFFVAAEFSIVKVRVSQLETIKSTSSLQHAKTIVKNLDSYLAATQLGITLASLGLGWVGESVVRLLIHETLFWFNFNITPTLLVSISVTCAFTLITIMHIVFGELAPKALAINYPVRTIVIVAWPMRIFFLVFRPAIWLFNGIAIQILKPFGMESASNENLFYSEDELKLIISDSQESGAIGETERELIENVFEFDECKVLSIATNRKDVKAIELKTKLKDALELAVEYGYSRYPVYDQQIDNLVGVISTKSLIKKLLYSRNADDSINDLIRTPLFISENAKIKHALKKLQENRLQLAITTNEVGEFSGVISAEDILEELVGEMQDEYDEEEPIVITESDNSFIVSAHKSLVDINKNLPHKFTESDSYSTLAGLIHHFHSEQEFQVGDEIELDNYHGYILKLRRNSVESIRLVVNKESVENTEL